MTKRKRKGSSKAGRPKQDGARYPSGQLRPPGPNARVLAEREALLGAKVGTKVDITKASNPLDLAHAMGWLTEREHRTAESFARIYRHARIPAPPVRGMDHHEVEEAISVNSRTFAAMSDAEVTEVFDAVFCDDMVPEDRETQTAGSLKLWGLINAALPPDVQSELFGVCVMGSWPQWVIYLASGKPVPEAWERRRTRLLTGLALVRATLAAQNPKRPPAAILEPLPEPRGIRGPAVLEDIAFVNENGEPVHMTSEHGRPFEVSRRVPARR